MKRAVSICICVFILYAAAGWALAGCESANFASAGHHHNDKNAPNGDVNPDSQHSHSDHAKVHCANFLGELVLTARISSDMVRKFAKPTFELACQGFAPSSGAFRFLPLHGPPILVYASSDARYLVLSVFRI